MDFYKRRLVANNFIVPDKYPEEAIFLTGVYMIWHLNQPQYEGKMYFGSTWRECTCAGNRSYSGFYGRMKRHTSFLRLGSHHNKGLTSLVDRYGLDGLVMEIITIEYGRANCVNAEGWYLSMFESFALNTQPIKVFHPAIPPELPIQIPPYLKLSPQLSQ